MKNSIVIILLLFAISGLQAQLVAQKEALNIEYDKVLKVPNRSVDELFERNHDWLRRLLKIVDGSLVVDKKNHELISFRTSRSVETQLDLLNARAEFDVQIKIKEGELHFTFSNVKFIYFENETLKIESNLGEIKRNNWGELMPEKEQKLIKKEVDEVINTLFKEFKKINEDC